MEERIIFSENIGDGLELQYIHKIYNGVIIQHISRLSKDDEEVGHFTLDGGSSLIDGEFIFHECFDSFDAPCSATINIDDEYREKKLSRKMIEIMISNFPRHVNLKDKLIFIGADSSNGFWERIGFTKNRHSKRKTNKSRSGYELVMPFKKLLKYVEEGKGLKKRRSRFRKF